MTSAAALGLTDVDALTMAMARRVAVRGLALFFGASRFRVVAGGALALILAATGGTLLLLD